MVIRNLRDDSCIVRVVGVIGLQDLKIVSWSSGISEIFHVSTRYCYRCGYSEVVLVVALLVVS